MLQQLEEATDADRLTDRDQNRGPNHGPDRVTNRLQDRIQDPSPDPSPDRDQPTGEREQRRSAVLAQMERIVASPLFRNSKRYPAFLRYTVEHALDGRTEMLKERTLGIEVFGRAFDYDTNADPVVRTTAGEIRKRLAQYYAMPGHEAELRFDLPVGSYIPHFEEAPRFAPEHALAPVRSSSSAPAEGGSRDVVGQAVEGLLPSSAPVFKLVSAVTPYALPEGPHPTSRRNAQLRWAVFLPLLALFAALAVLLLFSAFSRQRAINFVWDPFLHTEAPTLIVLGVHSLGPDGHDLSPSNQERAGLNDTQSMLSSMISSDMVPVSDVVSYSALVNLLARGAHPFRTQSAASTTFDQLQHGPIILLGGLDNVWTLRLTSGLRFQFRVQPGSVGEIVDRDRPQTSWRFDNAQRAVANAKDYALVASFLDPQTEQHVLIAAGIGKSGTAAAARFLTTDSYLHTWLTKARAQHKTNVELVLSTDMVEGQQGPPHVVADYSW